VAQELEEIGQLHSSLDSSKEELVREFSEALEAMRETELHSELQDHFSKLSLLDVYFPEP
jgi:uncharacterized membrane-anchored protein YhcB (DUF1043 family)